MRLSHSTRRLNARITLPASKSESNRVLIMQALSRGMIQVSNLSNARDTQTLERLLRENPETMNVGHAGTAMRFLTAYLAFRPEDKLLTGSSRMQQRPIGPLVEALHKIGADIHYFGEEGFPPLMIFGRNSRFGARHVQIPGHISSQYISALLLLAPTLPDGLWLEITGNIGSRPYIDMTLELMAHFGVAHSWEGQTVRVAKQIYRPGEY
ncbi:MAG: 3-phosphoshikimate 1-carboxyvinyltransferase, partial [Bacteroidota bacterium]